MLLTAERTLASKLTQAEQLPAGITSLNTGLTQVDEDDLAHLQRSAGVQGRGSVRLPAQTCEILARSSRQYKYAL